jgi:hypothetical protein
MEIHTAEQVMTDPRIFEVKISIVNLKKKRWKININEVKSTQLNFSLR